MLEWPTPKTVKGLRGFLGLSGFYRRFVRNYASFAHPLTELLKKNAFEWSHKAQQAINALKNALVASPVLSLLDFSILFVVQTEASGQAMGAILLRGAHLIAYLSELFYPRLAKASSYIRELHVITSAVKRWRKYLLANYFII